MIRKYIKMKVRERHLRTHVCRHRWSRHHDESGFIRSFQPTLPLKLMKATVLAESSEYIHFHRDLSAAAMSIDRSQVGVALFPSF